MLIVLLVVLLSGRVSFYRWRLALFSSVELELSKETLYLAETWHVSITALIRIQPSISACRIKILLVCVF